MKNILLVLALAILVRAEPTRVTDLFIGQTNGGLVLTWTAPTPSGTTTLATMDVRYSTNAISRLNWPAATQVDWLTNTGNLGTSQAAIITGLTPGVSYYVALKVSDSDGLWSTMSNEPSSIVIGESTYQVTLAWDANTEPDIAGYRMYVGTATRAYTRTLDAGNATTGVITSLEWGVMYYFAVTAVNTAGLESDYSNEVMYRPP